MDSQSDNPGLDFTGERVVLGKTPRPLVLEHLVRYRFAESLTNSSSRVLDVGCGSGYGSALLAARASHVAGVDSSAEAVRYARANYPQRNLSFACAECGHLPFQDCSFDRAILFEVIEHLKEQATCLNEIRRVLTPEGMLILSTPNPAGPTKVIDGPNPFHKKELQEHELLELLRPYFGNIQLFYQYEVNATSIEQPPSSERNGPAEIAENFAHDAPPKYFVAVCSRQPLQVPEKRLLGLDGIDRQVAIVMDVRQKERELEAFRKWREEKEREVASLRKWMEDKEQDHARSLAAHQEVISGLKEEAAALNKKLSEELAISSRLRGENATLENQSNGRRMELEWLYRWFPFNRPVHKLFYGKNLRRRIRRRLGFKN